VGAIIALASFAACNTQGGNAGGGGSVSGRIQIDGSSTVFPITEAIAEEFKADSPDVDIRVGQSGTGGGFEKFCAGETEISDASRPIDDDERSACSAEGVEYTELKVAIDGLSVVVNTENDFAECLTTDALKTIWEADSEIKTWKDVKAEWPDEEIKLYGPGADSGTFDYFVEEILGKDESPRSDYEASEDDNVLVQGVAGDQYALGYFGYAYYVPNTDKLKTVAVDSGDGCIQPTTESIEGGEYSPLSRPLYIYVNNEALGEEHISAFTEFYLDTVNDILTDVGYIALPADELQTSKDTLQDASTG
jgi:phosphate transport system substrate-binding protein